jgi:hypothetical protein
VLHAPPIAFFSAWSPEKCWVRSTEHSAPRYVVFSSPCCFIPLRKIILLSTLFSNYINSRSSLSVSDEASQPRKTTSTVMFLHILVYVFFDSRLEDKRFCIECKQAFPVFGLLLISSWIEFNLLSLFAIIWTVPRSQRNCYQSLYSWF